jgi:hypothetical protein
MAKVMMMFLLKLWVMLLGVQVYGMPMWMDGMQKYLGDGYRKFTLGGGALDVLRE